MPDSLWGEAFGFAVEVVNICGIGALNRDKTYLHRFGSKPDVISIRSIHTKEVTCKTLENPAKPGIFLGYTKHS
ncbi:Copia-like retrotransposable element [Phytophthora palmivora]|uniref:Copia-like retrotransposable element n=1 Tax=Phytophthora palmivora TaxID=4796 RepID=A0A2P4YVH2_9STRA|nr:Copia-like retrotransposable element [Phytophthora palmivora]